MTAKSSMDTSKRLETIIRILEEAQALSAQQRAAIQLDKAGISWEDVNRADYQKKLLSISDPYRVNVIGILRDIASGGNYPFTKKQIAIAMRGTSVKRR